MNLEFQTPRGTQGRIRDWAGRDFPAFAEINAEVEVMRYLLGPLDMEAARALFEKIQNKNSENGWGIWAVEVDGDLAGFTGLNRPNFITHFTPCVEIAWRFRKAFWRQSIAYAAAQSVLDYGFQQLGLEEIVAFTTESNHRSRRLMERLDMSYQAKDDFPHPGLEAGHPLSPHVLYRISKERATRLATE
ncbi:MAG: GNAT family N-acetyltransferase [Verrucomicrobiota bacterium]